MTPVIISDLDGTLLDSKKIIPPKVLKSVEKFRKSGGKFGIATGRTLVAASQYFDLVKPDAPVILYNGSIIYDVQNEKVLYEKYLPDNAKDAAKIIMENFPEAACEVLRFNETYLFQPNEESRHHIEICREIPKNVDFDLIPKGWLKILFAAPPEVIDKIIVFLDRILKNTGMYYVRSERVYVEILPENISKGTALEVMKKEILPKIYNGGIYLSAAGDYDNDIEMIKVADLGACPKNATETVKAVSDVILKSSCDDGAIAELVNLVSDKFFKSGGKAMDEKLKKLLKKEANEIRKGAITGIYYAKSGHPGGSLSIADTLAYLYFKQMNIDPKNPSWEDRDRFVLSKGHAAPALYAALAERGFFPKSELKKLRHIGSMLQGHPSIKTPGIDMSSGSLGQGISAACGMALGAKVSGKKYHVYSILGDGEIEEGMVWEAAMFAAHYKLDNLTAVVDNNGLQIDGDISEVCSPYPIDEKFEAFGWNVININAHDFDEIDFAFTKALECKGKPTVIIQKSIKGKGVSYMENAVDWHGKAPGEELYKQAMEDLEKIDIEEA